MVAACSGAEWRELTASAPWSPRSGMSSAVLNDSLLCLLGGITADGSGKFQDVWCSPDQGVSWVEEAAFPGGKRWNGRMEALENEVLYIAGSGSDDDFNDVWASSDMKTWQVRSPQASFRGRGSLASTAVGNKVFVVGGINYQKKTWTHFNDVWVSANGGRTWESHGDDMPWQSRGGHSLVALDNGALVLMGGAFFAGEDHEEQLQSDVWMSKDEGRTWQLMTADAPWGPRGYHRAQAIGNRMLLLGGFNGSYLNDVWESTDSGASWTMVQAQSPWHVRETYAAEVVQSPSPTLVIAGGTDYESNFNDVWSMPLTGDATAEEALV
eukprot:TRINITY_DN33741_c0_g1_i1.p1 TRINITY_DN33741_c0_g1~~TRINITY_DN33741_c0_g1_i1.p1  ORF type:complete len:352 (+),score=60.13 TRINITY_DN33741_c0_g1_i1:83-1057(+)